MSPSFDPALRSLDTEMFRRFWHPIVPTSLVAAGPRSIRLFGEDIVIWQDTAGTVSALEDRCSHQAVRLSLGGVRGNRLVCSQHRWEFDGSGHCTRIPERRDTPPPPGTRIRSFRAASRYGLAWVAVDDPVAPIPPIDELAAPGFRMVSVIHARWRVGALRLVENWLHLPRASGPICEFSDEPAPRFEESDFGLVRRTESASGMRCTASWWAPTCLALHSVHPTGLRQITVIAAAPLADRWSIVSRIHARSDSEADTPGAELRAADLLAAGAERTALEAMEIGAPEAVVATLMAQRVTRKLQKILRVHA